MDGHDRMTHCARIERDEQWRCTATTTIIRLIFIQRKKTTFDLEESLSIDLVDRGTEEARSVVNEMVNVFSSRPFCSACREREQEISDLLDGCLEQYLSKAQLARPMTTSPCHSAGLSIDLISIEARRMGDGTRKRLFNEIEKRTVIDASTVSRRRRFKPCSS